MPIHTGTFSVSASGLAPGENANGTLSISQKTPPNQGYDIYFQPSGSNTWLDCTQNTPPQGQDLDFSVTINSVTYTFTGTFTAAQGPNPAKYAGAVNDGHPSPRAVTGSWTATQTNTMPVPEAVRDHEAKRKAV